MSSQCDTGLSNIPIDEDLISAADLSALTELLVDATCVNGVQAVVATKVLHRKRPHLIPVLDSVMVGHYGSERDVGILAGGTNDKKAKLQSLTSVLQSIQDDVSKTDAELQKLGDGLTEAGWPVSTLRIHDILVWTEKEPHGYYR
jgi:DNA-binding protein YbaB